MRDGAAINVLLIALVSLFVFALACDACVERTARRVDVAQDDGHRCTCDVAQSRDGVMVYCARECTEVDCSACAVRHKNWRW